MNHNQETSIEPIISSSNKFGVEYQNNFVVLDDSNQVIGIDPSEATQMILENIENGKAGKIRWSRFYDNYIATLVYDEKTGLLYSGDRDGDLYQYKVDTASNTFKKVRNYGNIQVNEICSSHKFLDFIFFGGYGGRIKVLDLSTGELLPGHLETSIKFVLSFQVCVKSPSQIYLAVSGEVADYSEDKTDLFDISALISNNPGILEKYL